MMISKRNIILLIITLTLLFISVFLVFRDHGRSSKINVRYFAINDTTHVSKIFLEKKGKYVYLMKDNHTWTLGKNYSARPGAVRLILKALNRIEIKSYVQKEHYQKVIQKITHEGIKVIAFRNNKKLTAFYLFEDIGTNGQVYALKENEMLPFIVHIPGYDGYFESIFRTEEYYWRDRTIIKYYPTEIKRISVEYHTDQSDSYALVYSEENKPFILNHQGNKVNPLSHEDIERYLGYFKQVRHHGVVPAKNLHSSDTTTIVADLKITDHEADTRKIRIYRKPPGARDSTARYDYYYAYARINNETGVVLMKYLDLDLLLKTSSFFQKDINK